MIYCGIFALGILFNLLATYWLPFVYISIFIVGFSLGGSTNMSLSFPASIFGVLDYPKVNGVIFPINYCIGCLKFRRKRGSDEGDGKPDGRVYCISLLVPDQYPDRRKDGRRQVG